MLQNTHTRQEAWYLQKEKYTIFVHRFYQWAVIANTAVKRLRMREFTRARKPWQHNRLRNGQYSRLSSKIGY